MVRIEMILIVWTWWFNDDAVKAFLKYSIGWGNKSLQLPEAYKFHMRMIFLDWIYFWRFPFQRAGRLRLRRHRPRVLGRPGRGVQAVDRGVVVCHDGVRGRLPQELQALWQLQPEDHGLQREWWGIAADRDFWEWRSFTLGSRRGLTFSFDSRAPNYYQDTECSFHATEQRKGSFFPARYSVTPEILDFFSHGKICSDCAIEALKIAPSSPMCKLERAEEALLLSSLISPAKKRDERGGRTIEKAIFLSMALQQSMSNILCTISRPR